MKLLPALIVITPGVFEWNGAVICDALPLVQAQPNALWTGGDDIYEGQNNTRFTIILASIRTAFANLKKERCYIHTKILILANDDNHLNTRTTSTRAVQKYFRSAAESRCLLSLPITNRIWLKEKLSTIKTSQLAWWVTNPAPTMENLMGFWRERKTGGIV